MPTQSQTSWPLQGWPAKGLVPLGDGLPLPDSQKPDIAPCASQSRFGAPCSRIEIRRLRSVGLNYEPSLVGFIAGDEKAASQKRPGFGRPVYRRGIVGCVVAGTLVPARWRRLYELGSTGIRFSQLIKESQSVQLLRLYPSVGGRKKSVSTLHCCVRDRIL